MKDNDNNYKRSTCGDCGCREGDFHELGCDMEKCSQCGYQFISCSCIKPEYEDDLQDIRIPFINYPWVCCYCGKLWPKMFMVEEGEWEIYVEPGMRDQILCRGCYDYIVEVTHNGNHGLKYHSRCEDINHERQ